MIDAGAGTPRGPLPRLLRSVQRRPWPVLAGAAALAAAALWYAAGHLGVNNDTVEMLDEELAFRQTLQRLRDQFPYLEDTLLVVVEAPTPEQATLSAERFAAGLRELDGAVSDVYWPAGEPFFRTNGLLYRSADELEQLADRLSAAQPLLARLADELNLVTLFDLLAEAEQRGDQINLDRERIHTSVAAAIEGVLDGGATPLSWQGMFATESGTQSVYREILVVRPVLEPGKIMSARSAMEAVRGLRRDAGLGGGAVQVKLTGSVALGHDELRSVLAGAQRAGLLALVLVTAIMYLGLRSLRMVAVALLSLAVGLALTVGFAALAVGRVNLISVAFVVLYVGLGVNYAVHYLLRCRERLAAGLAGREAVAQAGLVLAGALGLSAVTTAIGFFAFMPTAFEGIAELGLIAGFAMFVTLVVTYTVIPALLTVFGTPRAQVPAERAGTGPGVLDWPLRYRRAVQTGALLAGVAALLVAPRVDFDSDPLNVRDPDSESVRTMRDLLAAGETGYRNLQVLASGAQRMRELVPQIEAQPSVERTVTIDNMVPANQDTRLARIEDLYWLLGPMLDDADWRTVPVPAAAVAEAAAGLAAGLPDTAASRRLDSALAELRARLQGDAAERWRAATAEALLGLLPHTMRRLGESLQVDNPVTRADLPCDLVRRWVSADGTHLVQVFPAVNVNDFEAQAHFADQVSQVAPTVTGPPVIQKEAGQAITRAFRQALLWAGAGVAAVLLIVLRNPLDTVRVLVPLLLGGVLTTALMILTGLSFNYANVMALPLLLGVGVDNGIHLVYRHRSGDMPYGNVLRTATAGAIVLGALVTAAGFGNLAFSPHAGTASLGVVLGLGLALIVLSTIVVLPALLRRG